MLHSQASVFLDDMLIDMVMYSMFVYFVAKQSPSFWFLFSCGVYLSSVYIETQMELLPKWSYYPKKVCQMEDDFYNLLIHMFLNCGISRHNGRGRE